MNMTKNVGGNDRIIRGVAGAALILLALLGVIGWWGFIGIIPLFTAVVQWCPLYMPLNINTNKSA